MRYWKQVCVLKEKPFLQTTFKMEKEKGRKKRG
jgi:hypothetical protein